MITQEYNIAAHLLCWARKKIHHISLERSIQ